VILCLKAELSLFVVSDRAFCSVGNPAEHLTAVFTMSALNGRTGFIYHPYMLTNQALLRI
jgi:hypothetical protein